MAGQDKFSKVSSFYCKGAGAAILAYDITDNNSFHQLTDYMKIIESSQENCVIVIVGTKLDLVLDNPEMRQVTVDEAKTYSSSLNAAFFETSARSNISVEDVFDYIGNRIFPYASQKPTDDSPLVFSPLTHSPNNSKISENICCIIQ